MLSIVGRLNTAVPGLGLSYDQNTGKLNKSTEAVKKAAQAQARLRYEEEKANHQIDLYTEKLRLEDQEREAKENLAAAQERLNALEGSQGPGSTLQDRQAYQEAAEAVELYQSELDSLQGTLDGVNAELEGFEAKMADSSEAVQSVDEAVANVQNALSNLTTAYEEAYTAAKESFAGQFGLFEEAAEVTATSFDKIISNFNSQKQFWADYEQNFATIQQAAQDTGVDVSSILSRIASEGPNAAGEIAGIAEKIRSSSDGGKQALEELAGAYENAMSSMDQAAQTTASAAGGVQEALNQVQQAVQEGAENLNIADQFGASAQADIDAVIQAFGGSSAITTALGDMKTLMTNGATEAMQSATDAATKGGQDLTTETGNAASNASKAFESNLPTSAFSTPVNAAINVAISAVNNKGNALVAAAQALAQRVAAAMQSAQAAASGSGLATGTKSAKPGVTWVGENGPELVFFRSGVTPASLAITASAMQDYRAQQTAIQAIPAGAMLVGTHGPELMYMQGGETVLTATETATVLRRYRTEHEDLNRMTQQTRTLSEIERLKGSSETKETRNLVELVYAMGGNVLKDIPAYAAGTASAQRGAALVGENGPELVYFQGGETVLPAPETMRTLQTTAQMPEVAKQLEAPATSEITQVVTVLPQIIETMMAYRQATSRTETERIQAERVDRIIERVRDYQPDAPAESGSTTVNVNITINGNATPETVDRLREFAAGEELKAYILEAVQEAQRDSARRAYR